VRFFSKPSNLNVAPWQMVSALLGGLPLRVASWWSYPCIYSTTADTPITCWDKSLGKPGPVEIALTGKWGDSVLGLEGQPDFDAGGNYNHAKLGVSKAQGKPLCIFGDMNQQGGLAPDYAYKGQKCSSSQNGRGGMFFVMQDAALWKSISALIAGDTAPTIANSNQQENQSQDAFIASLNGAGAVTGTGTGTVTGTGTTSGKKPAVKKKKVATKVAKKTTAKAKKKSAKKSGDKPAKKAAKKAVKKAAQKETKKSGAKPVKKAAKKVTQKAVKKTVKKAAKKAVKQRAKKSAPVTRKKVVKKAAKKAPKKAVKKAVKRSPKKAAKKR
jgi:hypothetical protein